MKPTNHGPGNRWYAFLPLLVLLLVLLLGLTLSAGSASANLSVKTGEPTTADHAGVVGQPPVPGMGNAEGKIDDGRVPKQEPVKTAPQSPSQDVPARSLSRKHSMILQDPAPGKPAERGAVPPESHPSSPSVQQCSLRCSSCLRQQYLGGGYERSNARRTLRRHNLHRRPIG